MAFERITAQVHSQESALPSIMSCCWSAKDDSSFDIIPLSWLLCSHQSLSGLCLEQGFRHISACFILERVGWHFATWPFDVSNTTEMAASDATSLER